MRERVSTSDRRGRVGGRRVEDVRRAVELGGLRRGQREAGRLRRLRPGARGAPRGARARHGRRSCRARSTARGASRPRSSWRRPRSSRSPAGSPRSELFDARIAAALPRPRRRDAVGAARARAWASTWTRTRWPRCSWSGRALARRTRPAARATASGRWSCAAWPACSTSAKRPVGRGGGDPLGGARVAARRGRRPAPAPAGRSVSSSSQTGSSVPWPAVRSSRASSRGSWLSRPGRCASTSASAWSANSGWRSQTLTISSIGMRLHPGGEPLVGLGAGAARRPAPRCPRRRRS